nr:hypothetical protein 8 [Bacillaceae bacterium]
MTNKIHIFLNLHDTSKAQKAFEELSEAIHAFEHRHGKAEIDIEVEISTPYVVGFTTRQDEEDDDEFFN